MTVATQPTRYIVIIGGGIIGSSIAYYLSRSATRAAAKITLVEASAAPAPAASGKAGGFLALDWHGAATASLAELSFKLHRQLADQDGGHEKWGFRQVETWQVNVDSNLKDEPSIKSKPAISWLDNDIVRSTSNMGGGGTTAQVHPGQLTQHLVDESRKAGVEVLFNSRASSLRFLNDRNVNGIEVKDTKSGETKMLDVDDLVIAAGLVFPRKILS